MLFVATSVDIGTVGKPLELFGTLEACCKLSFEEQSLDQAENPERSHGEGKSITEHSHLIRIAGKKKGENGVVI